MKILLIEDNRAISKDLFTLLNKTALRLRCVKMPNQPLTLSAVTLTFYC